MTYYSIVIFLIFLFFSTLLVAQRQQVDYFEGTTDIAQKGSLDQEELKEGLWKYYYKSNLKNFTHQQEYIVYI